MESSQRQSTTEVMFVISKTLGSRLQVLNTLPLLNGIVVVPGLARFLCIQIWIPKLQITGIISEKKNIGKRLVV